MTGVSGRGRTERRAGRTTRVACGDPGRPLPRAYFDRHPVRVARGVLGRLLVFDGPEGRLSGRIVETEAYRGVEDPASHAYRGRTDRNAVMFGLPGHAYVYFIYGVHFCLNLVTEREGWSSAVLVRALDPVEGLERMRARRGEIAAERLARGPGSLARALGLTREHNGLDLTTGPLWLSGLAPRRGGYRIASGPRIGIRQGADLPWRFFLAGHPCVSGPRQNELTPRGAHS